VDAIDGVVAASEAQTRKFWTLREKLSPAEQREGRSVKHDVSVPVDSVPDLIREAGERLLAEFPQVRLNIFGHVGDGNIHFNVLGAEGGLEQRINSSVHDVASCFRGSISAEHGVGCYRVNELNRTKSDIELSLMRKIRILLDPHNLLNPGKVVLAEFPEASRSLCQP
jgi:FAD/FMN-containing dehydrogenase